MATNARTASALKARIETLGLSLTAYTDRPPKGVNPPYVTVSDGISLVPDGAQTDEASGVETVQVDLWQQWYDLTTRKVVESPTLGRSLVRGLHKCQLLTAPNVVYGVLVTNARRLTELDNNLTHLAITATVHQIL